MPDRRLLSLDALRGLAVVLMIEQHLGVWLWEGPRGTARLIDYPGLIALNALGGGAAPLFVTLAGVGSALFVAASRPRLDRTLVQRGLTLIAFGLVLNLLAPSWFSWGSWFVLHMMGFAMILAPLWRRLSTSWLLAALVTVLVATVAVQNLLHTPTVLHNHRMRDLGLPGGVLRLALAEGQFPILPWLAFYLGGFVTGRWIAAEQRKRIGWLAAAVFALGGVLAAMYVLGAFPSHDPLLVRAFRVRLGFYPASPAVVLLLLGAVLVAIAVGLRLDRRLPLSPRGVLVTLGRGSLTLLILHVPLFREVTRPLAMWQALPPTTAVTVIAVVLVVCALLTRRWQRGDYRYGAEWLLRRIAG
jgi:uncharacterized membrane protein